MSTTSTTTTTTTTTCGHIMLHLSVAYINQLKQKVVIPKVFIASLTCLNHLATMDIKYLHDLAYVAHTLLANLYEGF